MPTIKNKIIIGVAILVAIPAVWFGLDYYGTGVLKIDQEDMKDGVVLNPSTQSINRYSSVARELTKVKTKVDEENMLLSLLIADDKKERKVFVDKLDINYLVPLLPYPHEKTPDDFDLANLMLAEYARNGIALSYQKTNSKFGVFNASANTFSSNEEYLLNDGMVIPNKDVKPVRFSVTNNCLKPGLWELSAKDTVGEMYHGWFKFPKSSYYKMVKLANDIDIPNWKLALALRYKKDLSATEVKLDRLRIAGDVLIKRKAILNQEKMVGAYSTQGSRRKSQKGYFSIIRDSKVIKPKDFSKMKLGDKFKMHKFVSPGIYSASDSKVVDYDPAWTNITVRKVNPLARYAGSNTLLDKYGYIELKITKDNDSDAIVVGNIPLSLLVFQDDYKVPAYGVGVLPSSELIERRYLRLKDGPLPHYAYQMSKNSDDKWMMVNNHETGQEQIYLRPFEKNNKLYLRITLVSYERIVDLLEVVVEVDGELEKVIREASSNYSPPMFRVYKDANVI